MNRQELKDFILTHYNAVSDYPWVRYPSYEVFRHPSNQKWFALLAEISASRLYPDSSTPEPLITVLNVKCDPVLSGSFRSVPGIHPAYHMNKDKWITIETAKVPEETIKLLIEMSFDATAPKVKRPRPG